ncbi:monooxygenase 2 isoform X2 [Brachypodium distachyon]|uniref:FAD-binding domain-containing protein n=1 Tax=Brachypodium distachyon TaxID=15368 RepID=I1H9L4_BRADI|nr:monooxygenase 2 isoform X2 [Brachypodium distachyon]KQK23589.1 hypothetical protein BRADI_1g74790v3 [Brachypodium distachyon]|eukprot:XP_014755617.1 monooxygenase 2 isoform X2 [Brachypodium distachyon]
MQQEADTGSEHVIVVGAGLAGLAVALRLHRKGVKSVVVLESSPALRASGYAITTWANAFRALDALGVGNKIRKRHQQIQGVPHHEARRVRRDLLVQALEEELPEGTIRYSSKVVSIQEDVGSAAKIIHLADGSVLRAKVLIGCDGVNSVVAKWLGLAKPSDSGRLATRGIALYPDGHCFQPKFLQFIGQGFRFGFVPCNEADIYWFYTWSPPKNEADDCANESGAKVKQQVLDKLRSSKVPMEALEVVERSEMSDDAPAAPLRFRPPLSLLLASISKGNVCVAGDALHPMTPDIGQGGCSALEDGYVVGFLQQSDNAVVSFLREKVLAGVLARTLVKMADYDCGTL